jgi:hypothetical protein
MSDLSPLSVVEQKWNFGAVWSVDDHPKQLFRSVALCGAVASACDTKCHGTARKQL